jgi:hypothetical protein
MRCLPLSRNRQRLLLVLQITRMARVLLSIRTLPPIQIMAIRSAAKPRPH